MHIVHNGTYQRQPHGSTDFRPAKVRTLSDGRHPEHGKTGYTKKHAVDGRQQLGAEGLRSCLKSAETCLNMSKPWFPAVSHKHRNIYYIYIIYIDIDIRLFIFIDKSLNQCKEGTLFWLPLLPGSQALLPDPADGNGEARGCAEAGGRKKPGHVGISYGGSPVAGSFSAWCFGTWFLWLPIYNYIGNVIIPTDELIFFRGV